MIILDTNVISEPAKPKAIESVVRWLDEQEHGSLCVTSINVAELFTGVETLAEGKRKRTLRDGLRRWLDHHVSGRVLPFDEAAAMQFAELVGQARRKGKVVSLADAQIASIAKLHGYPVATRDEAPFAAMGVAVVNPWNDEPRRNSRT